MNGADMRSLVGRVRSSLRRRALAKLHAVPEESSTTTASEIPLKSLLPMLFPDVPRDRADVLTSAARAVLGRESVAGIGDIRLLLGALDHQVFPSPVAVRFGSDDVVNVQISDFHLVLDRADFAVSTFVREGTYEPHVSAIIAQFCRPGMSVIDIGANIGFHTIELSRLVGDNGRVLAVEPSSENCRLLLETARQNECSNVELLPMALDVTAGWAYFTNHVGSNGGLIHRSRPEYIEGGCWIVPTQALDEVVSDRVDFIKIDVEGAEGRAMRGGLATLKRCRPIVLSEFSWDMLRRVSEMEPAEYLAIFDDLGYQLHVVDRSTPGHLLPMSPAQLLNNWGDEFRIEDLLFLPG